MVKDAEVHADEDKKKKTLIEARNRADQMVYTTEKTLKEYGDKISEDEKKKIEDAIQKVKDSIKGENADEINKAIEEMMSASHKIAEEVYKKTTAQAQAAGAGPQEPPPGAKEKKKEEKAKEGAVDADYEVVDDKDKEEKK